MKDIAERAAASYAMRSDIADGMDFFDVYEKAGEAIERARAAARARRLLECKTYRYFGHFVGDPLTYRTKEESEDWIQNRAIRWSGFERRVVEAGLLDADDLRAIDGEVAERARARR